MEKGGNKSLENFKWRLKSMGCLTNHDSQWKEVFIKNGFTWWDWWNDYCEGMHNLVGSFNEDNLEGAGRRFFSSIFSLEGEELFIRWLYGGKKKYLKPFYDWFIGYMESKKKESLKRVEAQKKEKPEEEKQSGYIYLLKSKGFYKIGRTLQPEKRIEIYQTENPFGIKVIFQKEVADYVAKETELLSKFKDKNHRGEWFKLNKEDILWIKENV